MKTLAVLLAITCVAAAGTAADMQSNSPDQPERDVDEIRLKIEDIKEVVQESYGALLVEEPELSGEIEISFSITPEGKVTEALVTCSETVESMEESVIEAVEALDFGPCPGQDENLPITVPFSLMPPQSD